MWSKPSVNDGQIGRKVFRGGTVYTQNTANIVSNQPDKPVLGNPWTRWTYCQMGRVIKRQKGGQSLPPPGGAQPNEGGKREAIPAGAIALAVQYALYCWSLGFW